MINQFWIKNEKCKFWVNNKRGKVLWKRSCGCILVEKYHEFWTCFFRQNEQLIWIYKLCNMHIAHKHKWIHPRNSIHVHQGRGRSRVAEVRVRIGSRENGRTLVSVAWWGTCGSFYPLMVAVGWIGTVVGSERQKRGFRGDGGGFGHWLQKLRQQLLCFIHGRAIYSPGQLSNNIMDSGFFHRSYIVSCFATITLRNPVPL